MVDSHEQEICVKLGFLEVEVMNLLWDYGPATVREMLARIGRPMAITTMLTTMVRLHKKGLASRTPEGNAHRYAASVNREDWQRAAIRSGIVSFPQDLAFGCLASLLDADEGKWAELMDQEIQKWRARRSGISGS